MKYRVGETSYPIILNAGIFSWQSMLGKRGIFANFATIFNL